MRRRALQIALIIPILAWPMVGRAGSVHLDGKLIQGGIVFGTTDPGAHVTLDGRTVRVAPDGRFVFGFGRDAADHATLEVVLPDGTQEERHLAIVKVHLLGWLQQLILEDQHPPPDGFDPEPDTFGAG